MKKLFFIPCCFVSMMILAQKKPLDHSVYDNWQSISDRSVSNDGKYLSFSVNPQEGDGLLTIQSVIGNYKKEVPRGYGPVITEDSRYVIFRIKPIFKDARDARIKKRKPDDMPKDSLGILELGSDTIIKLARIKSFKVPDDAGGWLAYLLEKSVPAAGERKPAKDSATRVHAMIRMADSLSHIADSIRGKVNDVKEKGISVLRMKEKDTTLSAPKTSEPFEEGTELVLRNLRTGKEIRVPLVSEFFFNRKGTSLLLETTRKTGDTAVEASVVKIDLATTAMRTLFKGFNEAKGYRMDEDGKQFGFVAERDSSSKSLQKFYKLYYHKDGMDSAMVVADRNTKGLAANWAVSENATISFSKSGKRLFAGTAPVLPVKDTLTPEFERVKLDIWHYNDDYIQPRQLHTLENDLKRNYLVRVDTDNKQLVQLGDNRFRSVLQTKDGDGDMFYAATDYGYRISSQWQGFPLNDLYAINPETGVSTLIAKGFKGNLVEPSYTGKYLLYYDERNPGYFVYNPESKKSYPIARDITTSLRNEENDLPDDPNAYGIVRWTEGDKHVLVYDKYDIWQVDPTGIEKSVLLTQGRKDKLQYRFINTNSEEKFLKQGQAMLLSVFDEKNKSNGIAVLEQGKVAKILFTEPISISSKVQKSKDADVIMYTRESYIQSPNVYVQQLNGNAVQLSNINPQQSQYNWGTAELFKWKAYTGKETEGIVYKPEDFDPKKKYPMILYFYERSSDDLHDYIAPAPTASRLNIPFFVSRGYIVFVPDIWYKKGYPGQSAYDYILSGTRAVVKQGYVDSTKIGLQGQSWGGYQITYLITKTNLYAAAWAGAPVANMTSAYGGIRWGTGMNRQFQYEKTQSRIGYTLWEKPNLYIENSALFSLPKIKTPLVIMANDADGAVPWYQGIEMFTGMRRLGKKVWLLNYNDEDHNLVERKNRKDIQVREQQFFDYLLKGEKPAKWIAEGVPALMKGRDLGLGYMDK